MLVVPRASSKARPHSVLLDDVLSNDKIGGLFTDAGLPAFVKKVQGQTIIIARKGWAQNAVVTATIESIEAHCNDKAITLHLSASRFLAGTNPYLWFAEGKWNLTITDQKGKEYTYDDIEFSFL